MTVPYAIRLLSVCLASFFLLHLALCAAARALTPAVLRWADRVAVRRSARSAAGLLLSLRFAPALVAFASVVALCLPSFLSFENERGSEAASASFLLAAILGASIWMLSLFHAARALAQAQRFIPRESAAVSEEHESVWLWEGAGHFLGLAGVLRPRVIVSRSVTRALEPDQFAAALRHERAHHAAGDNWKRLLLLLAPEALPGVSLFHEIDRAWARFAEWAADDRAVAADTGCALSLAEALVRVARLGAATKVSPLVSPFVPTGEDMAVRVDRLLNPQQANANGSHSTGILALALALPCAAAFTPGALNFVHQVLERLMH